MSYSKDTLCWRCKGNSGPSKAFAFWNIQQNERPHHDNGQSTDGNGQAFGDIKDNICKCVTTDLQDEKEEEKVIVVNTEAEITENKQNDITGMGSLFWPLKIAWI